MDLFVSFLGFRALGHFEGQVGVFVRLGSYFLLRYKHGGPTLTLPVRATHISQRDDDVVGYGFEDVSTATDRRLWEDCTRQEPGQKDL